MSVLIICAIYSGFLAESESKTKDFYKIATTAADGAAPSQAASSCDPCEPCKNDIVFGGSTNWCAMCGRVTPDDEVVTDSTDFSCRPLHEPNCVNGKWDGVCDGKIQNWVAAGVAGVDGWSADGEERAKRSAQIQNIEADIRAAGERFEAVHALAMLWGKVTMVLFGCVFVMLFVWIIPQQLDAGGKGKRQ